MAKIIGIIMCLCAMSFFFFPVHLTGMPSYLHTKLILAVIGIFVMMYNLPYLSDGGIKKDFISMFAFACGVSFATYLSVVLNNTLDYTYVTYVVSFAVWTSAAYVVIKMIQSVHGYVDVKLVVIYLMVMCALQCVLAMVIDSNADVRQFVNRWWPDTVYLQEKKRLYGFGCALDVAGGRFSAVLVMVAYLLFDKAKSYDRKSVMQYILYMICFVVISIIGNMIGRTTTVGMLIGILIIVGSFFIKGVNIQYVWYALGAFMVFVFVAVFLYNSDLRWHDNLRFGLEGFFSLVEKGRWEVHSNDMLREGFIFPDNLKTWLIGDGFFDEPSHTTPYYTGHDFYGFYMGTDAGYSRFLFYFGLIGLIAFSAFFVKVCQVCMRTLSQYKYMFLAILCLNFLIWIKVSTDIYLVFAPFLCLALEKRMECDKRNTDEVYI